MDCPDHVKDLPRGVVMIVGDLTVCPLADILMHVFPTSIEIKLAHENTERVSFLRSVIEAVKRGVCCC